MNEYINRRRFFGRAAAGVCATALVAPAFGQAASGAPAPLAAGDMAPPFDLQDQFGKRHRLQDYRGKTVVLAFYPKDFTYG